MLLEDSYVGLPPHTLRLSPEEGRQAGRCKANFSSQLGTLFNGLC
jgi:hypothetical protein